VPDRSFLGKLRANVVGAGTAVSSLLDWPIRHASRGALLAKVKLVRSAVQTYDAELAEQLWDVSAEYAKVPKGVQSS
jgi:hypothetical protein